MTCIAGIVHKSKVYIGADSGASNGSTVTHRADKKLFRNGPFLIGFTTSFRMGQLLRYKFTPPDIGDSSLFEYMVIEFVEAVRQCLNAGGYATINNNEETAGSFLVGIRGRLFKIGSDYQVAETLDGYAAVGSGRRVALGAMHATREEKPRQRINKALLAAAHHTGSVHWPFVVKAV